MAIVALCAVQAMTVLGPRPPPRLCAIRCLGLIPLAAIGGVALLLAEQPDLAQQRHRPGGDRDADRGVRRHLRVPRPTALLGLLAPVLYLIAWKGDGRPTQIATDALIAGADRDAGLADGDGGAARSA